MENALQYARSGWKLFPAHWDNGHKPYIRWSTESSCDPEQIKTWAKQHKGCYFCVALKQSSLSVIDIDNKKGKKGTENLRALKLIYGKLPDSLLSRTPSKGFHLFYKGSCAQTTDKMAKGVDTPGMVPIPGSIIKGKGEYKALNSHSLADLPQWVHSLAGATKEKAKDAKDSKTAIAETTDLPYNIGDAAEFLQSAKIAVKGSGSDNLTYQTACKTRGFGVSKEVCLQLMDRLWNSRCNPPWPLSRLRFKINNAYEYANSKPGESSPANDFEAITPESVPLPINSLTGAPPERKWLIRNWLPMHEVSSLYGKGGLGKSLLALQLGISVSGGTPFLSLEIENPIPVLYVACEDDRNELHRRTHTVQNSLEYEFSDLDSLPMLLWPRVGEDSTLLQAVQNKAKNGKFIKPLCAALSKMPEGPKLLILDTLTDLFAASENDKYMVNYFLKVILGSIIKEHDCTVLLLGHPAKAEDSDYSGSVAWTNGVRNRLVLTKHENENLTDYRTLTRAKANYALEGEQLTLYWDSGALKRTNTNDIFDEKGDTDLNIMQDLIVKQSASGVPYGRHVNCTMYLHTAVIQDANGQAMSKELKNYLVMKLIEEGMIEEVKGDKHRNGLWPT